MMRFALHDGRTRLQPGLRRNEKSHLGIMFKSSLKIKVVSVKHQGHEKEGSAYAALYVNFYSAPCSIDQQYYCCDLIKALACHSRYDVSYGTSVCTPHHCGK